MISPKEIHANAVRKGFWDNTPPFAQAMMLVVTECAEAVEADRQGDKEHIGEEIADAVIRLFDLAEGFGYDLEAEIARKHAINLTRPRKHGKRY